MNVRIQSGGFKDLVYCDFNKEAPGAGDTYFLRDGNVYYDRSMCLTNKKVKNPHPFLVGILSIEGILGVTVGQYQICAKKLKVYSWEELIPKIEKVITEHLN